MNHDMLPHTAVWPKPAHSLHQANTAMSESPAKSAKTNPVEAEQHPRKWYWLREEATQVWHTVWKSLTLTRRSDCTSSDQTTEATAGSAAAPAAATTTEFTSRPGCKEEAWRLTALSHGMQTAHGCMKPLNMHGQEFHFAVHPGLPLQFVHHSFTHNCSGKATAAEKVFQISVGVGDLGA